jgi:hypothetical protein
LAVNAANRAYLQAEQAILGHMLGLPALLS